MTLFEPLSPKNMPERGRKMENTRIKRKWRHRWLFIADEEIVEEVKNKFEEGENDSSDDEIEVKLPKISNSEAFAALKAFLVATNNYPPLTSIRSFKLFRNEVVLLMRNGGWVSLGSNPLSEFNMKLRPKGMVSCFLSSLCFGLWVVFFVKERLWLSLNEFRESKPRVLCMSTPSSHPHSQNDQGEGTG